MKHNIMYTVHDQGNGICRINNVETGVQVGQITARGEIITPPIVNGDRVSFVVQTPKGIKIGTTHKLPSGSMINQFRA